MKIHTLDPKVIQSACQKYHDFLKVTYGKDAQTILVDKEFELENSDDGVKGMEHFELEDELENTVVKFINNSTKAMEMRNADGTSTAGLFTTGIPLKVMKFGDKYAPKKFVKEAKEIREALPEAIELVKAKAKKAKTEKDLYSVAYASYNNPEIAKLIANIVHELGQDGRVHFGNSLDNGHSVERMEGLELEKGYAHRAFVNQPTGTAALADFSVLLVQSKLEKLSDIEKAIDQSKQKRFLIIADSFSDEFTQEIYERIKTNYELAKISAILVETPGFGDRKPEILEDIGALTGARIIEFGEVEPKDFGKGISFSATESKSLLIAKGNVEKHVKKLKERLETEESEGNKDRLRKRIAQLTGGIAILKIGAPTEIGRRKIIEKAQDALNATKLALGREIVPGAGLAFQVKTSSKLLNEILDIPREVLEANCDDLDKDISDPLEVALSAMAIGVSLGCDLLEIGGIIASKREKKDKNDY